MWILLSSHISARHALCMPCAMCSPGEKELDRLMHQGIIECVQFANWAAPIVPVLKSDRKSVLISKSQALRVDCYPITRIEDLFSGLHVGKLSPNWI